MKTIKERKNSLRKYSRCFKCLGKGHRVNTCSINVSCEKCGGSHNPALCEGGKGSGGNVGSVASPMHVGESGGRVAMQTAQALVRGQNECRVRVLFDSGSNKSFVTTSVNE